MRGLEAKIHRDCMILWSSDVFFFGIHRNLVFLLNPDVSVMYGFWHIHRRCYHLGPFRCIVTLVSVGDTSGLRFQCPSRCTETQIYLRNTSGWANIGHFRCIAKYRQNKIHRNSVIHSNPDVSQLISREYTYSPSQSIPARAGKNKQNTSEFNNFFQSRCIHINFTRLYLPSLAVYPRVTHFTQPTPTQIHAKADIILLRAGNRPYTEYRHVCRARLSRRYCRCRYFWQD